MTLLAWIFVIVVAAVVLSFIQFIGSTIKKVMAIIAGVPGKGFKKVFKGIKIAIVSREQSKLDKLFLREDTKARLNAARNNSSYRQSPKIKKILDKRTYKLSKKAARKAKK